MLHPQSVPFLAFPLWTALCLFLPACYFFPLPVWLAGLGDPTPEIPSTNPQYEFRFHPSRPHSPTCDYPFFLHAGLVSFVPSNLKFLPLPPLGHLLIFFGLSPPLCPPPPPTSFFFFFIESPETKISGLPLFPFIAHHLSLRMCAWMTNLFLPLGMIRRSPP